MLVPINIPVAYYIK